ncbi:MAG: hypothetical protein AB8H80_06885 [Planctomycetota bacterium]
MTTPEPPQTTPPERQPRPDPKSVGLSPLLDRLLGLCPLAIAVLWIAGVSRFRGYDMKPLEWAVLVAAAFAMHIIGRRAWRRRPLPQLPENARAMPLAGLVAMLIALLVGVLAGILELVANRYFPSEVPWGLRTLWHAACAFGASYCSFLQRLLRVIPA